MLEKEYTVIGPLLHDHERYKKGDVVKLDKETAAALLAVDVVVESEEPTKRDRLVEAIGKLPEEEDSLWTDDGKPKTGSIERLVGQRVSAAERDEAWEVFQENE